MFCWHRPDFSIGSSRPFEPRRCWRPRK
jgi:hypothetical protein